MISLKLEIDTRILQGNRYGSSVSDNMLCECHVNLRQDLRSVICDATPLTVVEILWFKVRQKDVKQDEKDH